MAKKKTAPADDDQVLVQDLIRAGLRQDEAGRLADDMTGEQDDLVFIGKTGRPVKRKRDMIVSL